MRAYHDGEWGVPVHDDVKQFEFLILEGAQAGLSWETVLRKREAYRAAFDRFDPEKVARYDARRVRKLLANAGIIRNRLKIEAAVANAKTILDLRESHDSFHGWIAAQHPLPRAEWVKRFKQTFRFTGGEIVGEFLMSTGVLPGAHRESCPVYGRILRQKPMWRTST